MRVKNAVDVEGYRAPRETGEAAEVAPQAVLPLAYTSGFEAVPTSAAGGPQPLAQPTEGPIAKAKELTPEEQLAEYQAYLKWRSEVESVGEGWMGGMGGGTSGGSRTSSLQGPGAFGIIGGMNVNAAPTNLPPGFDGGMDVENFTPPTAVPTQPAPAKIELPPLTLESSLKDAGTGGDLGMALGGLGLITMPPPYVWSDGSITGPTSPGPDLMGPPAELAPAGGSSNAGYEGYDDTSARIGATDLPSFDVGVTAAEQKSIREQFNGAFKEAREAGQSTFMFDAGDGPKPYTTGTREDVAASLRGGSKSGYQDFIAENFRGKDSDAGLAAYVDSLRPKAAPAASPTPLFAGEVSSFDGTTFEQALSSPLNTARVLPPDSALGKMVQNGIDYANYVAAEKAKVVPDAWTTMKNVASNGNRLLDEMNQVRTNQVGSDGMNALGKIADDFFSAIGSGARALANDPELLGTVIERSLDKAINAAVAMVLGDVSTGEVVASITKTIVHATIDPSISLAKRLANDPDSVKPGELFTKGLESVLGLSTLYGVKAVGSLGIDLATTKLLTAAEKITATQAAVAAAELAAANTALKFEAASAAALATATEGLPAAAGAVSGTSIGSGGQYIPFVMNDGRAAIAYRGKDVFELRSARNAIEAMNEAHPGLMPEIYGTAVVKGETVLVMEAFDSGRSLMLAGEELGLGSQVAREAFQDIFAPGAWARLRTFDGYGRALDADYLFIDAAGNPRIALPRRAIEFERLVNSGEVFTGTGRP